MRILTSVLALTAISPLVPVPALAMPGASAPPGAATTGPDVTVHLKDGRRVPLFSAEFAELPVARVGDEVVQLRELGAAFGAAHQQAADGPRPDLMTILQRLVDARLVVLEARAMGIGELPAAKRQMELFRTSTLRDVLKEEVARDASANPAKVKARYQDEVREWQVRSLLFTDEAAAKAFAERARKGGDFQALARQAVEGKKAEGSGEAESFREDRMLPAVLSQVRTLKVGGVSRAFKLPKGFAVIQNVGPTYPEKPDVRSRIEEEERVAARAALVRAEYARLKRTYTTIDQKVLKAVDFDAPTPGFAALAKDQRVVVRIKGGDTVTVADLAAEIRTTFFHGAERAAEKKRLDQRKDEAIDAILVRRLLLKEAQARHLEQSRAFRYQVEDFRNGMLFSVAVDRAVAPDVKVEEADRRAYYQKHQDQFLLPSFLRLEAIPFTSPETAQAGLRKLQAGTDFAWFAANAVGRLDPARASLHFDGSPVMTSELPPELARSLAGVSSGAYRLHSTGVEHYVIHVLEQIPARPRPFEEVEAEIHKKVQGEKLGEALRSWTAKLRQGYPVEILVDRVGA